MQYKEIKDNSMKLNKEKYLKVEIGKGVNLLSKRVSEADISSFD